METFFSHNDAYAVVGLLGLGLCAAVPFLAHYWYKIRRAELELSLKQAMVERGMSAADICAVIEAGEAARPDSALEAVPSPAHRIRA
jgi:hypothetical protein